MNKPGNKIFTEEYIRNFIKELLFITPPGGRLPGLRQLMCDSGVGRIRLEKVLHEFELAGSIEVRPQSGRYRTSELPVAVPLAFVHFSSKPLVESDHSFAGGTLKFLREKALENGQALEVINACGMTSGRICTLLQELKVKQLFIWGADNAQLVSNIKNVVPHVVSVLPRYPGVVSSELRDSPDMTPVQLEYLFNCNYRRIAYIHNAEDWLRTPVQLQRLMDYYRIMAENGIKIEPEWVFYCAYNREVFNRSMHRLLRSKRPVQALIVPGSSLKMLYDFCADNGIKIGGELGVMCCDDTEPELLPRATAVTNTPREAGIAAWKIMQETLQNHLCCQTTRLRIVTGETLPFIHR